MQLLASGPVTFLFVTLIRLIYATMRITVVGKEILPGFAARGEGYVGAFWHGRILMIPFPLSRQGAAYSGEQAP